MYPYKNLVPVLGHHLPMRPAQESPPSAVHGVASAVLARRGLPLSGPWCRPHVLGPNLGDDLEDIVLSLQ